MQFKNTLIFIFKYGMIFMSGLDNLMQIEHDIFKARDLIGRGILGEISFHIMNSKTDGFQLLTPGQLQKIQNAHPKKVSLDLEPSSMIFIEGKLINPCHKQQINYQDLWLDKALYKNYCVKNNLKNAHKIEGILAENEIDTLLESSVHWQQVKELAKLAIRKFPAWEKQNNRIQKTGNLTEWLTRDVKANTRQVQFIISILSDIYKELK